jgi:hypothetical protein
MFVQGRQNTGYEKLKIIGASFLPFDFYILRYKEGSYIPEHIDPVSNKKHYRLNIIVRQALIGGIFKCNTCIINTKSIKLFRPDIYKHSLTEVLSGTRYVLSIGIAI